MTTIEEPSRCELALRGARVVDPESGLDAVRTVGIDGGRIVAVTDSPLRAARTVDIAGLVVAPGFVDLHSHAQSVTGLQLQALDGVTTSLELEAGALPVAGSYAAAAEEGRPINFGFSASWTGARMRVLDGVDLQPEGRGGLAAFAAHQDGPNWRRPADEPELSRILGALEEAVGEGAIGIGVLLGYAPDSGRSEYLRLAGLAQRLGVPAFTHARYGAHREPHGSLEAVLEVISAAAGTGAHMHLCHLNSTSNRSIDAIADAIDSARGYGLRVTTEAYPYGAGSTVIGAAFLDPELLAAYGMSPRSLTYLATGERIADAARLRELRATDPGGLVFLRFLDEDDDADLAMLRRSLLLSDTAIATDAMPLVKPGGEVAADAWPVPPGYATHPRSAGCYARTFRWLVRETGALSLAEAVRRCSLLPAQILAGAVPSMAAKGRVQPGADADLVVFDPDTITDRATYAALAPSVGIHHVLVDGQFVVRDGELLPDARPGRPVRASTA